MKKYYRLLIFAFFLMLIGLFADGEVSRSQNPPPTPTWADVTLGPSTTVVILREGSPDADQLVVRTFYWQELQGIEKPIMRSITDVIPAIKNTAIGASGAPDPTKVEMVHIDSIKITSRMEWRPNVEGQNTSK